MKTSNRIMSADPGAGALKSYFTLASVAALVATASSPAPAQAPNPDIFPATSTETNSTPDQAQAA